MNGHEQSGNTNAHLDEALTHHVSTIGWEYKHNKENYLSKLGLDYGQTAAYAAGEQFHSDANKFAESVKSTHDVKIPTWNTPAYDDGLLIALSAVKRGLHNVKLANGDGRVDIYNDEKLAQSLEPFSIGAHTAEPLVEWKELQNHYASLAEPYEYLLKHIRTTRHNSEVPYVDFAVACGYILHGAQKMIQQYRAADKPPIEENMNDGIAAMRAEFTRWQNRDSSEDTSKEFEESFKKESRELLPKIPKIPKDQAS
jgi:hypothetical protein